MHVKAGAGGGGLGVCERSLLVVAFFFLVPHGYIALR